MHALFGRTIGDILPKPTKIRCGGGYSCGGTGVSKRKYYVVRIGYNGNDRYETYHLLYVNKQDKSDIRIEDPIEGTIIPLAQWEEEN